MVMINLMNTTRQDGSGAKQFGGIAGSHTHTFHTTTKSSKYGLAYKSEGERSVDMSDIIQWFQTRVSHHVAPYFGATDAKSWFRTFSVQQIRACCVHLVEGGAVSMVVVVHVSWMAFAGVTSLFDGDLKRHAPITNLGQ